MLKFREMEKEEIRLLLFFLFMLCFRYFKIFIANCGLDAEEVRAVCTLCRLLLLSTSCKSCEPPSSSPPSRHKSIFCGRFSVKNAIKTGIFNSFFHIINPLLTELVRSRWLEISIVLFVKKRTWSISSHLDLILGQ